MSFRFHPDAETEFLDAIQYYENVEPGRGLDLAVEVHAAIQRAVAYPKAGPEFDREIRRSLVLWVETSHCDLANNFHTAKNRSDRSVRSD